MSQDMVAGVPAAPVQHHDGPHDVLVDLLRQFLQMLDRGVGELTLVGRGLLIIRLACPVSSVDLSLRLDIGSLDFQGMVTCHPIAPV